MNPPWLCPNSWLIHSRQSGLPSDLPPLGPLLLCLPRPSLDSTTDESWMVSTCRTWELGSGSLVMVTGYSLRAKREYVYNRCCHTFRSVSFFLLSLLPLSPSPSPLNTIQLATRYINQLADIPTPTALHPYHRPPPRSTTAPASARHQSLQNQACNSKSHSFS